MDSNLHRSSCKDYSRGDLLQQQSTHRRAIASGLMRYPSAPSSFLSSILDCEEFVARSSTSPERGGFASFVSNSVDASHGQNIFPIKQDSSSEQVNSTVPVFPFPQPMPSSSSLEFHQHLSRPSPNLPYQNLGYDMEYGVASSTLVEVVPHLKGDGGDSTSGSGNNTSNLVRHSSLPAFFAMENGCPVVRGAGDYGGSRMRMSPISEISEAFEETWDDLSVIIDSGKGLSPLNESGVLTGEPSHQLRLQKILELQESVPCKIRAKRGCATHPRSIAERVRRTRISERMRKLQDLVPNMDQQTNTAEMLDYAVDYIKNLQRQVKALSDNQAKCLCSSMQKR